MPLGVKVTHVDDQQRVQERIVTSKEGDSGYKPDPDYHPTMKLVKCSGCQGVGIVEFVGGFNLKEGDALMGGRPIKGACFKCRRVTEMVPLDLSPKEEKEYKMLYDIQRSVDAAVKNGETLKSGLLVPIGVRKKYERAAEQTRPPA